MKEQFQKYAQLIVKNGVNLQKGEEVFISAQIESAVLVREVAAEAYRKGAKKVTVMWGDEQIARIKYLSETKDALTDLHAWRVLQTKEIVNRKAVVIHIISDDPNIFNGVSAELLSAVSRVNAKKCKKYYDSTMSGFTRWTIAAYPGAAWAKTVFPDLSEDNAVKQLWNRIAKAVRLDFADTLAAWEEHQSKLSQRVAFLNNAKIKTLRYRNSLGTDFSIGLPENYIFAGGAKPGGGGVEFNANIPTEEVFTAPHKDTAEGRVAATMPLIYHGNKIDGFWLEFKKGRVTAYHADKGGEFLKQLIETDEGSHYLGEVALVGYNSPIQNLKTLFYNTLFDENASCHLALGRAYPDCVKDGAQMSRKEQAAAGLNYSFEHEDFMIGSADLSITAVTADGKEIIIFKDGDWVI